MIPGLALVFPAVHAPRDASQTGRKGEARDGNEARCVLANKGGRLGSTNAVARSNVSLDIYIFC
jgi:hypothetical protein